jgi:hypothetical protein
VGCLTLISCVALSAASSSAMVIVFYLFLVCWMNVLLRCVFFFSKQNLPRIWYDADMMKHLPAPIKMCAIWNCITGTLSIWEFSKNLISWLPFQYALWSRLISVQSTINYQRQNSTEIQPKSNRILKDSNRGSLNISQSQLIINDKTQRDPTEIKQDSNRILTEIEPTFLPLK